MFDNNVQTYWHGYHPATENNKVVVSFKSTIMFHKLVFTARQGSTHQPRYQGVCLYLNNVKSVCTPTNRYTNPGDKIELKPSAVTEAKTVELHFPKNQAAVVAELEIYFKSQGTSFILVLPSLIKRSCVDGSRTVTLVRFLVLIK